MGNNSKKEKPLPLDLYCISPASRVYTAKIAVFFLTFGSEYSIFRENVFARPGALDKPIIPVLSRRIMSVYDEKSEPAGGFIWAIIAGGRIWPTEYIVSLLTIGHFVT